MLSSFWSKRDVNYQNLGTTAKHSLKKRENILDSFGVHREQQCYT